MDRITGKANHIEDYLLPLRKGQWFGWSDSKNKIYSNLIVYDGGSKPTEKECADGLAKLQSEYDKKKYQRDRKAEYDQLNQFELIGEDSINGTTNHKDAILTIKAKYPKE